MKYDPKKPFCFKPDPNEPNKANNKVNRLLSKYEEKFHCGVPTEPDNGLTDEELCIVLEECIRENITFEELTGFEYDEDGYD